MSQNLSFKWLFKMTLSALMDSSLQDLKAKNQKP